MCYNVNKYRFENDYILLCSAINIVIVVGQKKKKLTPFKRQS